MKLWAGLLVSLIAAGALVAPAVAQNVAKPAIVYARVASSTNPSTRA